MSRVSRVRGREPSRADLMFGLMVIQQRLDGLAGQLGEIDGRLGELERPDADPHRGHVP